MNESIAGRVLAQGEPAPNPGAAGTTIRRQLLGASLFPLAFFGLLSVLVTASALYDMSTSLVAERNRAQVQAFASRLAMDLIQEPQSNLSSALGGLGSSSPDGQLLLLNPSGQVSSMSGADLIADPLHEADLQGLGDPNAARSLSLTSPVSGDPLILAYSTVPGTRDTLVLVERWSLFMTPALPYQLVLVGLLLCGTLLSLLMLSVSIGHIMQPITELAATANRAIPGSVFHPVPERGPVELRSLTAAFNQMVIELAGQQSTLRQYAQKALLSQEEERQRLSHELHDGTVQDLVGLAQRLELCRSEMESDPPRAQRRLEELRELVQHTLGEVRQISNALRPPVLQDLGLPAALRVLCRELEQSMPEVRCESRLSEDVSGDRRLQPDMELAVFRVAQECLTNIRKHARQVSLVRIELNFDEQGVHLMVHDNGQGAEQPSISQLVRSGHLGFAGMVERARLFGGKLEVSSTPEDGTTVRMDLPR